MLIVFKKYMKSPLLASVGQMLGLTFLFVSALHLTIFAQTTVMSSTPVTSCSATWADPGGSTGNYGHSLDITQTFSPTSTASRLRVSFQTFATEQNFDKLFIYDGANTSANLLGVFSGTILPGTFTASNAQGQLTFRFVTDAQNSAAGWSATLSCITLPVAASNLALSVISQTQLDLTWQDNATNETGFKIERSVGDQSNFAQIATVGADVTSYQDKGLSANTVYFYRVRAYNGDGNAAFSNQATTTTLPNPPAAPASLAGTAISSSQIDLTWQDNATNETGFRLERSKANKQNFSQVATIAKNTTTYQDQNLEAATTYYYRIRAVNTGGNSTYSNELPTQTQVPPPPAPPANPSAQALSPTQVRVTWQDHATTETGFVVERSAGNTNNFQQVATLAANITTYTDENLTEISRYFYRVRAINAGGGSAYTTAVSAKTLLGVPLAPSGLTAAAISQTQVRLSWQDNSATETGYKLERKKSGEADFTEINTSIVANTTSFSDASGLEALTTYVYRIRAFNATGNSVYSKETTVTTWINVPQPPIGFTATPISQSSIRLNWQDQAKTETGYVLEVSVGNANNYVILANLAPNTTTYIDTKRTADIVYYYRLTAKNNGGSSTPGNLQATIPALPAAPDSLYLEPVNTTTIRLHWKDVSVNETEFIIERGGIGIDFVEVGRVGGNRQTFEDTSLTPLTLYDYRVKAIHSAGESSYSNIARIDLAVGLTEAGQKLDKQSRLYPNPGEGQVNVQLENAYHGTISIRVSNSNGVVLHQQKLNKRQTKWQAELKLAFLPPGLYLIEIGTKTTRIAKRWVKYP